MKKVVLVCLAAMTLTLTSCMSLYNIPKTDMGEYDVSLKEVIRPADAQERYGESTIVKTDHQSTEYGGFGYTYEDDMMKINWFPGRTQFSFVLENKTDHSIKLLWDEAAFVDANGSSDRIMHSVFNYSEKNNSQPASIIVRGAQISDIVLPTSKVYYRQGYGTYVSGGWETLQWFPRDNSWEGEDIKILLPLQIEDTVNEYIFTFNLSNFRSQFPKEAANDTK